MAALWWVMFALGAGIFLIVLILLVAAALASIRRAEPPTLRSDWERRFVLGGGVVMPAIVLMALMVLSVSTGRVLGEATTEDTLTVEVMAHQWWWEVRYPGTGVVTANEVHVPVGRPVEILLRSSDVIHSFWVPRLAGKIDAIPGRTNRLVFEASAPGEFRGQCAEFCGLQHAKMGLLVIAQPANEFAAWLEHQQDPHPPPNSPVLQRGEQVFFDAGCADCHTIRGTLASGTIGPDLTHVASRRTLAAGTVPNRLEVFADWIINPQAVKPGTQMPATDLAGPELEALIAYLRVARPN